VKAAFRPGEVNPWWDYRTDSSKDAGAAESCRPRTHKAKRFRGGDNPSIAQNEAFILNDAETRKTYEEAFRASGALYYGAKPSFDQVLGEIKKWIDQL
jgi:hypothetical protein